MIFTIVRIILGSIGACMALAFFAAVIVAADGEWGLALTNAVMAVVGIWFIRIAIHGTFSGNAPTLAPLSKETLKTDDSGPLTT